MDIKTEIKEEDPFPDAAVQTNTQVFQNDFAMKISNDVSAWSNEYEKYTKTKIKEEPCDGLQKPVSAEDLLQNFKSNTFTFNNDIETDTKAEFQEFYSQNEREIFSKEFEMKVKKCSSDSEAEIKEELSWLERTTAEAPSVNVKIENRMDEDFTAVELPRSYAEADFSISSDNPDVLPVESLTKDVDLNTRKDGLEWETYSEDDVTVESNYLQQTGNCNDNEQAFSESSTKHYSYNSTLVKDNVSKKHRKEYTCNICKKIFTQLSNLKQHNLIHEGVKPHKCSICDKSFTVLSHLKRHNLIHEGVKPHECNICNKSFTRLSHLKRHHLIHEGIKPHKCNTCEKSFTLLSHLKRHNLIHVGVKPHKCIICNKSFTQLSHLKKHNLSHEGLKPHKCNSCGKNFTHLSSLKQHNLIHEGVKPHKCTICDKSFTWLSNLKQHNLVHEGLKPPHKCNICEKSFTWLSNLKQHNLVHKGLKPHKCNICEKNFTHLSSLKQHNLIHEWYKQ